MYIDLDHLHQALAEPGGDLRPADQDIPLGTPRQTVDCPMLRATKVWFKPPLAVAVGAAPWTYSSWVTMEQMADQEPIGVRFSQCLMFLPDIMPERFEFVRGLTYRLHLQSPHEFPATTFYPTFEVPADIDDARVDRFLAYNVIPISFTAEELQQAVEGKPLVKVVFLPDPSFATGSPDEPETITSTDGTENPVQDARRRGTVLLVVRFGNSFTPFVWSERTQQAPVPPAQTQQAHGAVE